MLFPEKWLKNHPQFLLHFLIHIDILMLCRKFELILTKSFWVVSILKNVKTLCQNLKNTCTLYYSPWFFSEKWLKNLPQFLLHFLIHIDVLMLCRKFELIPTVMSILRTSQFLKKLVILEGKEFTELNFL